MSQSLVQLEAPARRSPERSRAPALRWVALAAITALAGVLRLVALRGVPPDPFYDAAVRSMTLSWHNFFFGAFEPGGALSIDKPPVDLWLQVGSVKLLGFGPTALKLPEALAGIASVPLLYAVVRRVWSTAAGLAAALALAVLPIEVITARSDTMDAVMMVIILLALLLIVRAAETGRRAWLIGAAAALGVAFNVKLLESLVALPGLLAFAYIGLPGPRPRRALNLAAAGAVYVAVALSWLTATLLVPAHERPYAIGSTNGSAWNAAFVFNGTDRLSGRSPEPQFLSYQPGHRYPEATQAERDRIPIVPPSATRLLARIGPLSGQRLGLELLAGLLLGLPALLWGVMRDADVSGPHEERAALRARLRRATAAGMLLWTLAGIVLFSAMTRLHPRYVEAFTPAVALLLGIGAVWAAAPRRRARTALLAVTLAVVAAYAERLLYGTPAAWWITLAAALGALGCAALARLPRLAPTLRARLAPAGVAVLTLVAVLAVPFGADVAAIKGSVSDAGRVGALPAGEKRSLSTFLRAHQGSAEYELAAESSTAIGSLVEQDARPVLVLTTYAARVFTPIAELKRLIAAGRVRYAYLNTSCDRQAAGPNAACTAPARWIRAHGTDVSRQAGLRPQVLWLLPGARA